MASPYASVPVADWAATTSALVAAHPLYPIARQVVEAAWGSIFESRIGRQGLRVWHDFFPDPQTFGDWLHLLIPLELALLEPGVWRGCQAKGEKDIVYIPDPALSVEIKTSGDKNNKIFANRSYAQPQAPGAKNKDGFYLTVNFNVRDRTVPASLTKIRMGWLDHSDWRAQKSPKGQQASLPAAIYAQKLLEI